MSRRLLLPLLLVLAGCGAHTSAGVEPLRATDGSLRLPAPGGSFATWNEQFPLELEAVLRGETPAAEVWAGLEDDAFATPTRQRR